ncbi:hypothetical protein BCR35DRAFT_304239 [Leucosporidium creatinivorum]|uniref:Transmembrane protein n=1 Tax=Leucosporidium creatinivorum TaxID=106004 RepID=A0A1Y2F9W1_9BASI|nr:hypothetical protein BCR35DRAFT_304239 [Leucosporidium creatinivorum]
MLFYQRDRLWLFRLVKREGSRYIVGNSHTLVPIFAISLAPSLLGNIATDASTYLHHGEQSSSDSWSVSLFPILFAGSWLWSCSGLQAFLLAGGNRRLPVGPRVANITFIGGLVAGVTVMTVLAVVGAHISVEKSKAFFRLDGFIHPHWEKYDLSGGVVVPSDLRELYYLAQGYDEAVDRYQALFIKLLYVFAATPFCIGFINLGTLALFLLVRRQVSDNRKTFRPFGFLATLTHHERTERTHPSQVRSSASRTDDDFVRRLQQLEEVQDELLLVRVLEC